MELVEPIRDKAKINAMKKYLRGSNMRDYLLFVLGINTGMRIGDLLQLRIEDVRDAERIEIREQKTNKLKNFPISKKTRQAIDEYMSQCSRTHGPLFLSREGENQPITRYRAHAILSSAARAVGLKERIGTHSLRKTFGYHAYKNGMDVTRLQVAFNHSSQSVTLRYIGITQEQIDEVYFAVDL